MDGKKTLVIDTHIIEDMTVGELRDLCARMVNAGSFVKANVPRDTALAASYMWSKIRIYSFDERGLKLTLKQFQDVAEYTRLRFLQQHMINYITYTYFVDFRDWVEAKKMKTYKAEGFWRRARTANGVYLKAIEKELDQQSYMLFLDHMSLSYDAISSQLESLEAIARDYLIQHRATYQSVKQRDDIELLSKVVLCFTLVNGMLISYDKYFEEIFEVYGVQFRVSFKYAQLTDMSMQIMRFCEAIGVRNDKDKFGQIVPAGVPIYESYRFVGAWNALVKHLGDPELQDDLATNAINLNPSSKEEYDREMARLAAENEAKKQKEIEDGFRLLQEKYNVKH